MTRKSKADTPDPEKDESLSRKHRWKIRFTRDGILLFTGLCFAWYEVVIRGQQGLEVRYEVILLVCSLCWGVPWFMRSDERKMDE